MMYKVCQIQEKEIDKVIDFHKKYLGQRDFINKKEIYNRFHSNSGIFLTAKDNDNRIIGIKLGYIDKDICIGRGIAIEKKYRRLGIGENLVRRFEKELKDFPHVKKHIFASSTKEGIPFHMKLGYEPTILLQSKNKDFIKKIDLKNFTITQNTYNKTYNVNQIYIKANKELDLKYLSKLKSMFPGINIQYLYEKSF